MEGRWREEEESFPFTTPAFTFHRRGTNGTWKGTNATKMTTRSHSLWPTTKTTTSPDVP